jgi:DNA invertase Pin-like site-specific DNA recombinase
MTSKIHHTHTDRQAVVYLRQSTLKQVYEHRESTSRQYALKDRAIALGWPVGQVEVVDDDLGQSGSQVANRHGFLQLSENVAKGRVGAIFALEVSRLARSCADWHRLLELCDLANVVIIDENAVYNPSKYDDKLLLGLKGQMSEAEQHWMRLRLQGGKLSKARRGELPLRAPPGYQWDYQCAGFRFDPDEQVHKAVRLISERFRIEGSGYGVVRYFAQQGLKMPSFDIQAGKMRFIDPDKNTVMTILRSPVYAGAYVYGRTERKTGLADGKLKRKVVRHADPTSWKVCIQNRHPAYISWEEYMNNQQKLLENRTNHRTIDQRGAARDGPALLQGLALCGLCGRRMHVKYQGRFNQAQYQCYLREDPRSGKQKMCFNVSATRIDHAVANLFLRALGPQELELGFAVFQQVNRQTEEVNKQWSLQLEQAKYEARLAERRYKAIDPDNRVVARTLEREWNEKLELLENIERQHNEVLRDKKIELDAQDKQRILSLTKDLPGLFWRDTTTNAERKTLLRIMIREVVLSPVEVPERSTCIKVFWESGAVTETTTQRPTKHTRSILPHDVLETIRNEFNAGKTDSEIADVLNQKGHRTAQRRTWKVHSVRTIRLRDGLHRTKTR